MRVGDVLEILAGCALVAALYLYAGTAGALVATAACLAYLAQVYSDSKLRIPRLHRTESKPAVVDPGREGTLFNCTLCGTSSPWGEIHQCPELAV